MEKLKKHPFFSKINFDDLEQKLVQPIFVPKIDNNLDLSNIDRFFTREEPSETPEDDSSILKKEKFEQFTYIDETGFINHKNSLNETDNEPLDE